MNIQFTDFNFVYEGTNNTGTFDINLQIASGECVVLCGLSGCGKTTLTRLVNGLIPELYQGKTSGCCLVGEYPNPGTPIYNLSTVVGSVFQNPKTQFFTTDVRSELAFPCENSGMPPAEIESRITEIAQWFNIQHLLGRKMFALSGGEKQMVAIASAYMLRPAVMVLDEPSSNLDDISIDRLEAILSKLKAAGCTLIISEHRLYYLTMADRFVYLSEGRIKRQLTTGETCALPPEERAALGLRQTCLQSLPPAVPYHTSKQPVLEIKHMQYHYRGAKQPALDIENLSLYSGEIVGIIGHNGAGKSTFAKQLCGLEKGAEDITYQGRPIRQRERTAISAMVMQDVNYQLFCETVEKELQLKATNNAEYDTVVDMMHLRPLLKEHPMRLSGGEKQRVAIACAYLLNKKLVILDEPTSGLDYANMQQVHRLLQFLKEKDIITMVITHDKEFLQKGCDRLLRFENGKICDDWQVQAT